MPTAVELATALAAYLPETIYQQLWDAGQLAADQGLSLYLIGGSVRDMLLSGRHFDWDIDLVSEQPEIVALATQLAQRWGGELQQYPQYGTATLRLKPLELDFATARVERYERPGANPEVAFSTLHDDLQRRDFSINAMALNLHPAQWCELTDPFQGVVDLERRSLCTWHKDKFLEDPVRCWRAARLSVALGFELETNTAAWLRQTMNSGRFDGFLSRRICTELWKCLEKAVPEPYFEQLADLAVLRCLSPDLRWSCELRRYFGRVRELRPLFPEHHPAEAYLLGLLLALADPWRGELLRALHLSRPLQLAWQGVLREYSSDQQAPAKVSEAFQRFKTLPSLAIWVLWASTPAAELQAALADYWQRTRFISLPLSGKILLEWLPRGPWIREILWQVQAAYLDGQIQTEQEAHDFAQQLAVNWCTQASKLPKIEE